MFQHDSCLPGKKYLSSYDLRAHHCVHYFPYISTFRLLRKTHVWQSRMLSFLSTVSASGDGLFMRLNARDIPILHNPSGDHMKWIDPCVRLFVQSNWMKTAIAFSSLYNISLKHFIDPVQGHGWLIISFPWLDSFTQSQIWRQPEPGTSQTPILVEVCTVRTAVRQVSEEY